MNLIGKEVHVSYEYGGNIATIFGTITNIEPLLNTVLASSYTDNLMMVEVTDGNDVRYIPARSIIHIHIGKLE